MEPYMQWNPNNILGLKSENYFYEFLCIVIKKIMHQIKRKKMLILHKYNLNLSSR